MTFPFPRRAVRVRNLFSSACCALLLAGTAGAAEFSVTPIRAELKPGVLSETFTVQNHSDARLRVSVKLMAWRQDASGADVYEESTDLVYFPRQLEVEPGGRKLVRVGAKAPAGPTERTYRLYIEEQPEAAAGADRAQVQFYFRFGVPIFLAPAAPRPLVEAEQPTLDAGKLSVVLRNPGNQHVRIEKVTISDGASYTQEVAGWYSLAGSQRTYAADIPRDVCRRTKSFSVVLEGQGVRMDRKVDVAPASCG